MSPSEQGPLGYPPRGRNVENVYKKMQQKPMHLSSTLRLAFDVVVLDVVVVAVVFVVVAAFSSPSGGGALIAQYWSPRRMCVEGYCSQRTMLIELPYTREEFEA